MQKCAILRLDQRSEESTKAAMFRAEELGWSEERAKID